jgi:hypothetical protein
LDEQLTRAKDLPLVLREKCQESIFFVATALLGYQNLNNTLHYEMCQVAQNASVYHRCCAVIPRDHYKTSLFTITYPVWRGLRNPNETGLIVANNMTNAERMVSKIRAAFENAPLLRQLFPELLPEKSNRWNKEEACLPRTMDWPEATWTAAGWETRMTSGHFDYIIFDDLVDETSYESVSQMKSLTDRFEQREMGLLKPPSLQKEVIVVGNHWSNIDLLSHIYKKHPEYFIYYRQAIEDGQPIFPEMYTLEQLMRKQHSDPYHFATQWMNNPADPALAEMPHSLLQYYKRLEDGVKLEDGTRIPFGQMHIYATCDPRHSLSTSASERMTSRNAIEVGGIDSEGRRFLLEEWGNRGDPLSFVKKMLEIWKRWYPYGIIKMGVESYGYQAALQPLSNEIWKNEPIKPVLELLPKDTVNSKETRGRGGLNFFRQGLGYIHPSCVCFTEEYDAFPHSFTKDFIDCWAWLQFLMNAPARKEERQSEIMADINYYRGLVSGARI